MKRVVGHAHGLSASGGVGGILPQGRQLAVARPEQRVGALHRVHQGLVLRVRVAIEQRLQIGQRRRGERVARVEVVVHQRPAGPDERAPLRIAKLGVGRALRKERRSGRRAARRDEPPKIVDVGEAVFVFVEAIDSGQYLKLDSLGDFRNGEYGDLVIQVEMVPTDEYDKMNNDLIYNLFMDLNQIQSDKFIVPHPDGDLSMSAPKVFDTSKPLRLKGKGYNGGDMYVKLNVRFERKSNV